MKGNRIVLLFLLCLVPSGIREVESIGPIFVPGAAVGGLVTGIIGTVLGSISVAVALGKLDLSYKFEDDYDYHGYAKRSLSNARQKLKEKSDEVEGYLDATYARDSTQCIELLMCHVSKRSLSGNSAEGESDILHLIEENRHHGYTFKKMMIGKLVGSSDGDCEFLFGSCPLQATQMVDLVTNEANKLYSNSL